MTKQQCLSPQAIPAEQFIFAVGSPEHHLYKTARETAAERDRLKESNRKLLAALKDALAAAEPNEGSQPQQVYDPVSEQWIQIEG